MRIMGVGCLLGCVLISACLNEETAESVILTGQATIDTTPGVLIYRAFEPDEQRPVPGVVVALHAPDHGAVEAQQQSDAEGFVRFETTRSRGTVTLAYQDPNIDGMPWRVDTFYDMPLQDGDLGVFLVDAGGPGVDPGPGNDPGRYRLRTQPVGDSDNAIVFRPGRLETTASQPFVDVAPGTFEAPDTGLESALAFQQQVDGTFRYGFDVDYTAQAGDERVFALDHQAQTFDWREVDGEAITPPTPATIRDGLFMPLSIDAGTDIPDEATSGTLPFFSEFPFDVLNYGAFVFSSNDNASTVRGNAFLSQSLPASVEIDLPDLLVTGIGFSGRTVTVQANSGDARLIASNLTLDDAGSPNGDFRLIHLPASARSITLPDLPEGVAPSFDDSAEARRNNSVSYSASGGPPFDTYDDAILAISSGSEANSTTARLGEFTFFNFFEAGSGP